MSQHNDKQQLSTEEILVTSDSQLKTIHLRSAEIGNGTLIKRALPSREKRMIGAWCFLDHAGPVSFDAGDGLDVGPHPHIGLQTFTWMIAGTVMHNDSLGSEQLIRPGQVNLMTAGYGISHTEVAPSDETTMHAAQLWIALPDCKRNMQPQFEHYPQLPVIKEQGAKLTLLVGEYLEQVSPVKVHTPLLGIDIEAVDQDIDIVLELRADFEHGLLALEGSADVNSNTLTLDNMLICELQTPHVHIKMSKGSRVLLIGGQPFESDILLWWNFVARTTEEIEQAKNQWEKHDSRFGEIPAYHGNRLIAPELPGKMRASK